MTRPNKKAPFRPLKLPCDVIHECPSCRSPQLSKGDVHAFCRPCGWNSVAVYAASLSSREFWGQLLGGGIGA